MTELLAVVGPILLVDVLNPVLLAALIFAAGSARPVLNSGAMLLGHTLAYLGVGLVVFHAMDALAHPFFQSSEDPLAAMGASSISAPAAGPSEAVAAAAAANQRAVATADNQETVQKVAMVQPTEIKKKAKGKLVRGKKIKLGEYTMRRYESGSGSFTVYDIENNGF